MEVNLSIHPVEYHGHLWSTTKPNLRTAEVSFPLNFEPVAKSDNGIKISMDGKGRAEHIYLYLANGGKELYDGVHEYMPFITSKRCIRRWIEALQPEAYFGTKPYFEPTKYSMLLV